MPSIEIHGAQKLPEIPLIVDFKLQNWFHILHAWFPNTPAQYKSQIRNFLLQKGTFAQLNPHLILFADCKVSFQEHIVLLQGLGTHTCVIEKRCQMAILQNFSHLWVLLAFQGQYFH